VKEPWRKQAKPKPKKDPKKRKEKLKKKGVGTFELDKPLEKDNMDMQWNFGVFEYIYNLLMMIFSKRIHLIGRRQNALSGLQRMRKKKEIKE
jgi:hypothetical protein